MFFRRILERKDSTGNNKNNNNNNNNNKGNGNGNGNSISNSNSANEFHVMEDNESVIYDIMNSRPTEGKDNNNNSNHNGNSHPNGNGHTNNNNNNTFNNHSINLNGQLYKMQRAQGSTSTLQRKFINTNEKQSQQISTSASGSGITTPTPSTGGVQLSPLWEHILRTRRLPETICPDSMFAEFHERLQDPEWQVRQHALRVLVDVLVVMGANADRHMDQLTTQLVENLGHQAPTVRKGALDCLRVYLSETAMPETIMLHILDIGLNRHLNEESFGGRLTCGVMLSLPALLQSILHTTKRHFILRTTIDLLVQKMTQLMQQEITLKVLAKIRELIGETEFDDYMTSNALQEFLHLCKVYGVTKRVPGAQQCNGKTGAWRALQANQASNWRAPPAEFKPVAQECSDKGKVIMETEIKLNDETLTMRILEADTDMELESPCDAPKSLEGEIVCRTLPNEREHEGILQVISDSDMDEPKTSAAANAAAPYNLLTPLTPTRSLKRVTFGGEIVKMRTPDSDASNTNMGIDRSNNEIALGNSFNESVDMSKRKEGELPAVSVLSPLADSRTTALTLDIPSDNTKPLSRPKTAQSPQRGKHAELQQDQQQSSATISSNSPARSVFKRSDSLTSLSPRSPYNRSKSISPVDSIISPKAPHKEIEVLHNLQRDPSPMSARSIKRSNSQLEDVNSFTQDNQTKTSTSTAATASATSPGEELPAKTWEDLDIVDYKTLLDLRSGDWRNRLQGIAQLELALRSSTTLAQVQPHLDSLLRTLLSSERNYEVAEEKRDLLINLITRLPLDNLEDRTPQILSGLCRQSNAGANRVCKALMQRLPAGTIVAKLSSSEFLHAKSSKFREHALQMAIYALMTFPSTCFDTTTCVSNAIYAALNRKRRVRQAALEMLSVLGEIATPSTVLEITEQIAEPLEEGSPLVAGVRKRLSRKQLPCLTQEGALLYALQPGGSRDGADIDWIAMGEGGSASPNALRRRKVRCGSKQSPLEHKEAIEPNVNYHSDESLQRHFFHSPPETYEYSKIFNEESHGFNYKQTFGNVQQYGLTTGKGFNNSYMDRRLMRKTCSDSSMDGRSSDSTNTGSSGSGSFIQLGRDGKDGINGRFTRQTSRFPTMNHIDLTKNFRIQRPPQYYPGMGPYAYLQQQQYSINASYPKINYNLSRQHRKKNQIQKNVGNTQEHLKHVDNQKMQQHCNDGGDGLNSSYTICQDLEKGSRKHQNQSQERFINMGNGQMQSSKTSFIEHQTTTTTHKDDSPKLQTTSVDFGNHDGSPISTKSMAYSQKSTASAKSSDRSENVDENRSEQTTAVITIYDQSHSNNSTTKNNGAKNSSDAINVEHALDSATEARLLGVLVVDDLESEETSPDLVLKRNESLTSLHSKSESIKTQLEDTPQTLSRAQSVKSLAIEEDIEDNNSFIVVEENLEHESGTEPLSESRTTLQKSDVETDMRASSRMSSVVTSNCSNEVFTHTRCNSLESLYERPASKQGSLDTTTTDYSSQASSQLNQCLTALPIKAKTAPMPNTTTPTRQHTPLKEKSKTSYFLRSRRRVSPVKQTIKMSQPELFPQSMTKFDKPREALLKAFDQLDSSDWEVIMTGLKSMVRLMRFHPEYLENQMHMVCIQLTRSVRNLRSQVARAACQASTELFALKSKYLETECDDLVCALLLRTADTNRFLRADATRALESMCDHLQPPKILNILTNKGVQHQNALVRTTTAKLLNRLVERLGCDRIFAMGRENRDKFFVAGANLLLEGSLETRSYAKSLFRALSDHASYNRLLLEVIPPRTYRNIEKTLKNITR